MSEKRLWETPLERPVYSFRVFWLVSFRRSVPDLLAWDAPPELERREPGHLYTGRSYGASQMRSRPLRLRRLYDIHAAKTLSLHRHADQRPFSRRAGGEAGCGRRDPDPVARETRFAARVL